MVQNKLQDYALVAEILSAVAVVASLMFVGLQIQQGSAETALNTRAIESNAYQNLVAQIGSLNAIIIENPDFAKIRQKIFRGEAATGDELAQFNAYVTMLVRHGDLAFRQYKNGLIDERALFSVLAPLRAMLPYEASQDQWEFLKPGFDPEYVEHIESMLKTSP